MACQQNFFSPNNKEEFWTFKLKFEVQKIAIYSNTNCIDSLLKPALTRIWLKRWYASVGRNNNILFAHLFANCQQRVFLLYTIMIRYKIRGKSSVWFTRTFFAEHYWRSKGIVFCSDVLHKIGKLVGITNHIMSHERQVSPILINFFVSISLMVLASRVENVEN